MIKLIDKVLKNQNRISLYLICTCLVAVVASFDYLTGYEISFFIFYAFPILIATWYGGKKTGVVFSLVCLIAWSCAALFTDHVYAHPLIPVWNGGTRLAFFIFSAYSLNNMKEKLELEAFNADFDSLTGILNGRGFREHVAALSPLLEREKKLYALAFIDVDNFKTVNDTMGHAEGDLILKKVAGVLQESLRHSDLVCRMGGDEFVVFFPNTDEKQAKTALSKLKSNLDDAVDDAGWPIGFSLGAGIFDSSVTKIDEAIKMADTLMYDVKRNGKGQVLCQNMSKILSKRHTEQPKAARI